MTEFEYRAECLRVLLSPVPQAVLRSIMTVFGRTRDHHLHVAARADTKGISFRHRLFWSHPWRYLDHIALPSLREALRNPGELNRIGFTGPVAWTPSEAALATADTIDLDEGQEILRLHVLTCVELLAQWFMFCLLPHCPPWMYIRALSPDEGEKEEALCQMQAFYDLLKRLERSGTQLAQKFLGLMQFRDWPVVREPLALLANGLLPKCLQYIREIVADWTNTLFEENVFNALRDNENRGARHKQRGEHYLSALAQSATRTTFPGLPHVEISDRDVQQYHKLQVRAEKFHPESLAKKKKTLGVPVDSLTGKLTWKASTFDDLAAKGASLFKAVGDTPEELWPTMFFTALMPRNTIVGEVATGTFFYVAAVTDWRTLLWRLEETPAGLLKFDFDVTSVCERTVTSKGEYLVYDHQKSLAMAHDRSEVLFQVESPKSYLGYCATTTLHTIRAGVLTELRDHLGTPKTPNATKAMLVRDIVTHLGYAETAGGRRVIAYAEAEYAKRVEARRKKREAAQEAGAAADPSSGSETSDAEESVPVEHTRSMDIVGSVAPRELEFLLGNVAAGMALNEEEEDPEEYAREAGLAGPCFKQTSPFQPAFA